MSLTESIEKLLKILGVFVIVTYAVGLLIVNFYLSIYSISDFELIRTQYVLTGIGFFVYLLSPVIVLVILFEFIIRTPLSKKNLLETFILLILCACILPTAFQYFLAPSIAYNQDLFFINSAFNNFIFFWRLYWTPLLPMLILLWICPILLLYFSNQPLVKSLETLRKRRFALVCALAIGALSQMMLYSMNVYPNVVASAGGGQPQVARIYLKSISGLQPITEPHQILETNSEVTTQYDVVILHKDERNTYFLFVKDFTNKKSKYAVFSVRNEFIEATLNLNAAVIFYPFKKERVVIFLDDDAPQK